MDGLYEQLIALTPEQLDDVISRLDLPEQMIPPESAPQAQRVRRILTIVRQAEQKGIDALTRAIDTVRWSPPNNESRSVPSRDRSPKSETFTASSSSLEVDWWKAVGMMMCGCALGGPITHLLCTKLGLIFPQVSGTWFHILAFVGLVLVAWLVKRHTLRSQHSFTPYISLVPSFLIGVACALVFTVVCSEQHAVAARPATVGAQPHETGVNVYSADLSALPGARYQLRQHLVQFADCRRVYRRFEDLHEQCNGQPSVFVSTTMTHGVSLARALAPSRHVILYVHGEGVEPEEAVARLPTAMFDAGLSAGEIPDIVVVRWGSDGRMLNYGRDYRRTSAAQAAIQLRSVLEELRDRDVTIIAHSTGNELLFQALSDAVGASGVRVRQVVSLNADVPVEHFQEYVRRLKKHSDHAYVFVAADDQALRMASLVHGDARMGMLTLSEAARHDLPQDLVIYDMTDVEQTAADRHGQFWSSAQVDSCVTGLATGSAGTCRVLRSLPMNR